MRKYWEYYSRDPTYGFVQIQNKNRFKKTAVSIQSLFEPDITLRGFFVNASQPFESEVLPKEKIRNITIIFMHGAFLEHREVHYSFFFQKKSLTPFWKNWKKQTDAEACFIFDKRYSFSISFLSVSYDKKTKQKPNLNRWLWCTFIWSNWFALEFQSSIWQKITNSCFQIDHGHSDRLGKKGRGASLAVREKRDVHSAISFLVPLLKKDPRYSGKDPKFIVFGSSQGAASSFVS